ncbi:MAG: CPXCG motif-containing cysteine-rich protein [Cyanobacteria bacterium P01_H01_bin.26]
MQTTADYYCAYCGEPSTTFIDISSGLTQQYVEDCQVCCRPNILDITIDEDTLEVDIQTDCEDR